MRSSRFDGEGFAEHQPTGRGQLVKKFITLEPHGFLDQMLYTYFLHCPATGIQNGDQTSQRLISVGRGILLIMLITLKLNGIF